MKTQKEYLLGYIKLRKINLLLETLQNIINLYEDLICEYQDMKYQKILTE